MTLQDTLKSRILLDKPLWEITYDEWEFLRNTLTTKKDAVVESPAAMLGSATLIGFTKEEVKEMVEEKYGSCVWGIEDRDGNRVITTYPNDIGGVFIADE